MAPYGRLPVAVGEVCQLTYFCTQGNIHAHTTGYNFIGSLVVGAVPPDLTGPPYPLPQHYRPGLRYITLRGTIIT